MITRPELVVELVPKVVRPPPVGRRGGRASSDTEGAHQPRAIRLYEDEARVLGAVVGDETNTHRRASRVRDPVDDATDARAARRQALKYYFDERLADAAHDGSDGPKIATEAIANSVPAAAAAAPFRKASCFTTLLMKAPTMLLSLFLFMVFSMPNVAPTALTSR